MNRDMTVVFLTDRDGAVYDTRGVATADIDSLNEIVQQFTDGEMWWETRDVAEMDNLLRATGMGDLLSSTDWSAPLRVADFPDKAIAQRFKQQHPDWQVYWVSFSYAEVDVSGQTTAVSESEFLRGMGYA
jgi:hypothetical protein